jgi:hypothetical protein
MAIMIPMMHYHRVGRKLDLCASSEIFIVS